MAEKVAVTKWTSRGLEALSVSTRTDFSDPETKGLMLRVTPRGTKTWAVLYNRKGDSKKRRITLGEFPSLGLSEARTRAGSIRDQVRAGKDPAAAVVAYKKADTVAQLLDLFLERHPRPEAAWTKECKRIFAKDVRPLIGRVKLPDLTRSHVRQVIDAVQSRGATVTVNRTLAALRRAFSWAISKDLMETNPAMNMATDIEETIKDRALSIQEIKAFWSNLDNAPMGRRSALVLRLVLVTGQRPGEVCGARKSEINLDDAQWVLPARRAKNRQVHVVPLSDLAVQLFKEAIASSGDSEFVFPSRPRKGRSLGVTTALQPHALSHAMRKGLPALGMTETPATPHDLRRTAATQMARIGISDRIVGRVLNHGTELRRTITSQVYIHHDYAAEKRQALEAWALELTRVVNTDR